MRAEMCKYPLTLHASVVGPCGRVCQGQPPLTATRTDSSGRQGAGVSRSTRSSQQAQGEYADKSEDCSGKFSRNISVTVGVVIGYDNRTARVRYDEPADSMKAWEEDPVPTSLPTEKQTTGDSAGERTAVQAENDGPRPPPPGPKVDDVGRLPVLLYAFIALLLMAATVSLVA